MKLIDKTVRELNELAPDEALRVLDFVLAMKGERQPKLQRRTDDYLRVRDALKGCPGSLSDNIIADRADRI